MPQTVLVVDDEKNIRRTLRMVLEGEGYAVDECGSAEEALGRAGEADAVLLDVKLPGMSGLDALPRLKPDELPVIMISGHGTLADAVQATKLGAFDFLEKPLDRDRVVVTVRNALERRASRARDKQRITFLDPHSAIARTKIKVQDARAGAFLGAAIPQDLQRQWIQGTGPAADAFW